VPIRPDLLDLYPDDWAVISARIRFGRAGGRCECHGECGRVSGHLAKDGRCRNHDGMPAWGSGALVRLATAHRDHWPPNVDDDNLVAFCQGCHLAYDQEHHVAVRRERQRVEAGLVPLF
jgi:hypothetical protein